MMQSVPVLRELGRRELAEVEAILEKQSYPPGEVVFREGDPGTGVYVVLSGSVEVSQNDGGGGHVVLSELHPGSFFGELALLDDTARTATATAAEATELALLRRSALLGLAEEKPQLGVKVVMNLSQIVADRLRRTNRALKEVRSELEASQLAPSPGP